MTYTEAFALLEEALNKYIPVEPGTNNTQIRRVMRQASIVCAWPAHYTLDEARTKMELDDAPNS